MRTHGRTDERADIKRLYVAVRNYCAKAPKSCNLHFQAKMLLSNVKKI